MKRIIKFCRVNDEYGFLSNFSYHSFNLNIFGGERNEISTIHWKTSEHYYQAMKFAGVNPEYSNKIRLAKTPYEAAKLGRNKSVLIRPSWDNIKEHIMEDALIAKFSQNLDIKKKLIETGDAILVEHRKVDRYWGDGGNGTGKNRLGELLMWVRTILKE